MNLVLVLLWVNLIRLLFFLYKKYLIFIWGGDLVGELDVSMFVVFVCDN